MDGGHLPRLPLLGVSSGHNKNLPSSTDAPPCPYPHALEALPGTPAPARSSPGPVRGLGDAVVHGRGWLSRGWGEGRRPGEGGRARARGRPASPRTLRPVAALSALRGPTPLWHPPLGLAWLLGTPPPPSAAWLRAPVASRSCFRRSLGSPLDA